MNTARARGRCDASRIGSLSLLAIAVAASLPAAAQQQPAAAQEEIIVTGSRVSRSGFDSSQPLTTIDSQQIENLGSSQRRRCHSDAAAEHAVLHRDERRHRQLQRRRAAREFARPEPVLRHAHADAHRHAARRSDDRGRRRRSHADPVDARGADRGRDGRRIGAIRLRRHRRRRQRDPRQGSRRLQSAGRLRRDGRRATAAIPTLRSRGARPLGTTAAAT